MNSREIESWALRVIERVTARHPNEDLLVELKDRWPENPNKTARRIAGHANAARGEPILWLIGIDQDSGIHGAAFEELAEWWPRVQAEFHGIAPSVQDINLSLGGLTVVALVFETHRAPFVVRNAAFGQPGGGSVQLEVPWREVSATRSANHNDLLLLLLPLSKVPHAEIISAALTTVREIELEWTFRWSLDFKIFVNVPIGERLALLNNCFAGSFAIHPEITHVELQNWNVMSVTGQNVAVFENGVSLDAPNIIRVSAAGKTQEFEALGSEAEVGVNVLPVGSEKPMLLKVSLNKTEPITNANFMWALPRARLPWENKSPVGFM